MRYDSVNQVSDESRDDILHQRGGNRILGKIALVPALQWLAMFSLRTLDAEWARSARKMHRMFFNQRDHSNEAKRLPRPVREYMVRNFGYLPEYLDILRCFDHDGLLNGEKVKYVHVFSPYRASEHHVLIARYRDLEEHPELLLFEGYTDSRGNVCIMDRRSPVIEAVSAVPEGSKGSPITI